MALNDDDVHCQEVFKYLLHRNVAQFQSSHVVYGRTTEHHTPPRDTEVAQYAAPKTSRDTVHVYSTKAAETNGEEEDVQGCTENWFGEIADMGDQFGNYRIISTPDDPCFVGRLRYY